MKPTACFKPLTDAELGGLGPQLLHSAVRYGKDFTSRVLAQAYRANALAAAIQAYETEVANPVVCFVMRRQRRKELFEALAQYQGGMS